MSKAMSKPALVPRLRFPEFREAGEWESKQLDQLIITITPPKKIPTTDYLTEGQFPIIDQGQSNIAGWTNDQDSLVDDNQPLIIFGDHTCVLKLVRRPFAQGADGIKIIKSNRLVVTEFLYQFLCFRPVAPEEYKRHFSILKTKAIAYSERKNGEQQKIADCLSSLDELIAEEAQKLNTLKTHKKGLMQQLFPHEGETVPRLRFPEFREAGEWKSNPFEWFVVKSFYGTSNSTSENGQYPVLRMSNMIDGGLDFSNLAYIDLDSTSFKKIQLFCGDILLNRTNSPDLVGKISMFDQDIECITASYIVTYRLDKEKIVPAFCNFMLNTQLHQTKIKALARPSVSQANINPSTFRSELIVFAPKVAEQQKIAAYLSSLDDLITAQAQKIDTLKAHKKGLMQGLFPSFERK
jgi:type I restriction enzyme S subunit